jgi:hypothetical protein
MGTDTTVFRAFADSGCDGTSTKDIESAELVVLDWTGGFNRIYPNTRLLGVDLSLFSTKDGDVLDTRAEDFKEDVRSQVQKIYCERGDFSLRVINSEDDIASEVVTVVHITQELPPRGGTDVGEGEYDPCNQEHDNAAILFGERLLTLSDEYTYDEWVNVFANICAHEIGHTLGFGHVSRDEYDTSERALYIELMLGGHTMAELRRQHRFLVDLPNCPVENHDEQRVVASGVTD